MKKINIISLLVAVFLLSGYKTIQNTTSLEVNNNKSAIQEADFGIITKRSFVDVKTTMDRLEKIISKKEGIRVFIRINHAENSRNTGAENVGDSELIIFGNPKVGLKMLSKDPRAGLDLPLKILAYEGKDGKVYISYRDVSYYGKIYNLEGCKAQDKMSAAINKLSDIIIKSPKDFKIFLEQAKAKTKD